MLAAPLTEGAEWMASNKPKASKTKPGKNYRLLESKSSMRPEVGTQAQFKKKLPPRKYRHGNPLHVLVCGTNYGRIYLEAFRLGGTSYRLAGLLARGSTRSQCVAREYGVPLYRCLADLTPGIDLACAAMGASGSDVVLGLLARGIHVLCEHPLKSSRLQSALEAAGSRGLCFHVNGHFANMEAAAAFISHCRRASGVVPPSFFHVTATDRTLYAALDILRRVLVSFAPFQFRMTSRLSPFTVVQGLLGGVPVTFHLQCGPLADGSSAYLVDDCIAAGFPSGILTLLSMNGPVVWNANLNCAAGSTEPTFTMAQEDSALTADLLRHKRIAANLAAIAALVKDMREHITPAEQAPEYLLEVSRAWETLGSLL
jgi:thiazolinyl imide reductase